MRWNRLTPCQAQTHWSTPGAVRWGGFRRRKPTETNRLFCCRGYLTTRPARSLNPWRPLFSFFTLLSAHGLNAGMTDGSTATTGLFYRGGNSLIACIQTSPASLVAAVLLKKYNVYSGSFVQQKLRMKRCHRPRRR